MNARFPPPVTQYLARNWQRFPGMSTTSNGGCRRATPGSAGRPRSARVRAIHRCDNAPTLFRSRLRATCPRPRKRPCGASDWCQFMGDGTDLANHVGSRVLADLADAVGVTTAPVLVQADDCNRCPRPRVPEARVEHALNREHDSRRAGCCAAALDMPDLALRVRSRAQGAPRSVQNAHRRGVRL